MDYLRIVSFYLADRLLPSLGERWGDLATEITHWPPEVKQMADISLQRPSQLKWYADYRCYFWFETIYVIVTYVIYDYDILHDRIEITAIGYDGTDYIE